MEIMEIKMFRKLCVTIVLSFNFFIADAHLQSPLTSKYTNITVIIGETIEIDCSEYMESEESSISSFKWYKIDKSLNEVGILKNMLLGSSSEILRITKITNEDEGFYECNNFNKFQNIYIIFALTVIGLPKPITYLTKTSSQNISVGIWRNFDCFELPNNCIEVKNFKWFKNEIPLIIEESDEKISFNEITGELKIKYVTYQDGGTYKCLASNTFWIDSSEHTLNVLSSEVPEHLQSTSYNYTFIKGDHFTFLCDLYVFEDRTQFNHTWLKNDRPLKLSEKDRHITLSQNNFQLYIKNMTFDDSGNYKCSVFTGKYTYIRNIILNVFDYPEKLTYRWYSSNVRVSTGVTLQLTCYILQSTQKCSTQYSWKKNGEPYTLNKYTKNVKSNWNKKFLIIYNMTVKENGTYECEAENFYHKISSIYTLNFVDPEDPKIYNSSETTASVSLGGSLQLYCYARGYPTPAVKWLKNGLPFDTPENNSRIFFHAYRQRLIFKFTILEDSGSYQCKVMNKFGRAVSNYNIRIHDEKFNDGQSYSILIYLIVFPISILGGVMIYSMICCVFCFISLRREKALKKDFEANKLQFLNGDVKKWNADLGIAEQIDLLPYDKKWEFPKNKLIFGEQLGSGAFGVVFKADAIGINSKTTSTTVAVKMVKPNSDSSHTKALTSELKIMIHIGKHLNIVNVLGACTEDINNGLMVIVEYCRFGCLREYLLKQRDRFVNQLSSDGFLTNENRALLKPCDQNVLHEINSYDRSENTSTLTKSLEDQINDVHVPPWCNYQGEYDNESISLMCTQDLLSWSFQISRGMEYLSSKKVLHGDLAIRNILLADDKVVKISDFGLAKTMHNYDFYKMSNNVPLPVKWMAIESLRDQVFSTKSDVWSFGIVLWEIFSLAETPYPNIISFSDLYDRLISGYRMKQPKYANHEIYNIMSDCWNIHPKSRPSFIDLTRRIGDLLQECSKAYYVDLNEKFIEINSSPSTHYAKILSSSNHQTMSDENLKLNLGNPKLL